jgi:hypothetical protein
VAPGPDKAVKGPDKALKGQLRAGRGQLRGNRRSPFIRRGEYFPNWVRIGTLTPVRGRGCLRRYVGVELVMSFWVLAPGLL